MCLCMCWIQCQTAHLPIGKQSADLSPREDRALPSFLTSREEMASKVTLSTQFVVCLQLTVIIII